MKIMNIIKIMDFVMNFVMDFAPLFPKVEKVE